MTFTRLSSGCNDREVEIQTRHHRGQCLAPLLVAYAALAAKVSTRGRRDGVYMFNCNAQVPQEECIGLYGSIKIYLNLNF